MHNNGWSVYILDLNEKVTPKEQVVIETQTATKQTRSLLCKSLSALARNKHHNLNGEIADSTC